MPASPSSPIRCDCGWTTRARCRIGRNDNTPCWTACCIPLQLNASSVGVGAQSSSRRSEVLKGAWPSWGRRVARSSVLERCPKPPQSAPSPPAKQCFNSTGQFAGGHSLVQWERFLPDLTDVIFLQLGANRGPGKHEPIWEYATSCGWRGLAFEPINATFRALCRNYLPYAPRVEPVRAAVSNYTGSGSMLIKRRYCPFGECNHLISESMAATKDPTHLEEVEVTTLEAAWEELRVHCAADGRAPLPRIDLLVVDVEGHEWALLGDNTNRPLPRPLPRLVMFEHKQLVPAEKAAIDAALKAQGYHLLADVGHPAKNNTMHFGDLLYGRNSTYPVLHMV